MKRRELITLLGGAAAWPLAARAQNAIARPVRIGTLHLNSPPDPWLEGLRLGLRELGYVEGKNLYIVPRWAQGDDSRLNTLVQELIDDKVDVLVTMLGPATQAARRNTSTVPIVMAVSSDGVGAPGVASLVRPGSNVTGLTLMSADLAGLRLSILKETIPTAQRIAVLYNATERPTEKEMRETELTARKLDLTLLPVETRNGDALDQALADAMPRGADALITFAHGFALFHRKRIAELAAKYRLPAMYGWREYTEVGGLMSYGPNVTSILRRAANFVDRIVKGANPADMPIEQPTRFEFVINLRTARALGITVPPTLLARADEVIE
jgi:putative ABC transport system substrate-binding protein